MEGVRHMMIVFDPGVDQRIMVCVTPQKSCKRLIERGAARAKEANGQFVVIYVNKRKDLNRELKEQKILLELFEYAKNLGGNVSILSGERVYNTLAEFAINNKITRIIVGKSLQTAIDSVKNEEIISPMKNAVKDNGIEDEVVE